ncbi:hypothetical protein ACOME3_004089 [Neoechinorhynchus agilis]
MYVRNMEMVRGPRLCHLCQKSNYAGYGFNLICHKNESNRQLIGKVDPCSPAQMAGLEDGDVVIEVNGYNVRERSHRHVVNLITQGFIDGRTGNRITDQVILLVADPITDAYYRANNIPMRSEVALNVQQRCSTSICVKLGIPYLHSPQSTGVVESLNLGLSVDEMKEFLRKKYLGKRDPRRKCALELPSDEKYKLVKNL